LIEEPFLAYLREKLGNVGYAQPPRLLTGGFVTDVYDFALTNAPREWSRRLVVRVYPEGTDPMTIRRERCAQDVVFAQGVPAPRVFACEDTADALGRPFMVMEYLPGRRQLAVEFPRVIIEIPRMFTQPRRHAAAMSMVHELDAQPLVDEFERAGIDRRAAGPDHWLDGAEASIDEWRFEGLRPGLDWLRTNRPQDPPRLSICHGDFFGGNILEQDGRVTGILDWNLVTVADAAFDVGGQIAVAEMSPIPAPWPMPWIAVGVGRLLARGLRRTYPGFGELSQDALRYYAAGRAFTEMTYKLAAQARVRATGVSERMPTWRPAQCARYFRNCTGMGVDLRSSTQ
jgi:aminoglycoside phosphotransferase (APT) family kinase protein